MGARTRGPPRWRHWTPLTSPSAPSSLSPKGAMSRDGDRLRDGVLSLFGQNRFGLIVAQAQRMETLVSASLCWARRRAVGGGGDS
eukprot:1845483-Pyramimonas_sp.AAC.1